jgi:hypothetical protein
MTGNGEVRQARSLVLNFTGWMLVQTRQWDAAETALRMSMDAAGDRLAAVTTRLAVPAAGTAGRGQGAVRPVGG